MAHKLLPPPTGRTVRDLHEKLVRDWDDRLEVDRDFRDLVYQKNPIELLADTEDRNMVPMEIHSGRPGGIIDHANGLLQAMPNFSADVLKLTTQDAREAEQIERVAAALFEEQLLANDFWNSVGRDILIYARAFVKSMLFESLWTEQEGYPVRLQEESGKDYLARVRDWKDTAGNFPFVIQHIPAMTILPLLDAQDNILVSLEEKYVTAKILAEEFGSVEVQEALQRRTLQWYDELTVMEYIDRDRVGYFLTDMQPRSRQFQDEPHERVRAYKMLRVWEHGLGKHPIVMIPGIRTELPELVDHFKGFLHDARDALHAYDFLLSRLATVVYAYYLPSYQWTLGSTTAQFAGRDRPVMDVNLGGVTVTYVDEQLSILDYPQNLPDASMLMQQLDDIIQRHTLEDVLFGRVAGSAPAFQVALRINVAKSKLTPIAQHMAQGLTNVIDLFLRGVEQLGEAVVIDGEKITVKMAKKYRGRLVAQIQPKTPGDRNQDIGAANMAVEFGLPWDWIVENILDIEDPATLRLQKDILEIEQLPQVKEKLMADALEQLEILVEESETEDLAELDLASLPPELAQAVQGLLGGGDGGTEGDQLLQLLSGATEGPPTGRADRRGGAPDGAAAQSLQGGRGLLTANTQPEPGSTLVGGAPGLPGGADLPV